MMRRFIRSVAPALAMLALTAPVQGQTPQTGSDPAGQTGGMVLDRVVAVVNEEALTLSELQEEGQPVVRKIFQDFIGPERERRLQETQRQLLDQLIDRRLVLQAAKREGTLPSGAEVAGAIEELKRNNNATDEAQFRALLLAEGLTLEQLRRNVEERLAISRLLARQIRSSIIIGEDELTAYYQSHPEQFKRELLAEIRHILVAVRPGRGEAAARARAEEARMAIEGGEDFVQVARRYSDMPSADGEAGVITVHRGEMAPEIETVAFNLAPGSVSPPIRTAAGWHLIKVVRAQREPLAPFSEVRDSIRERLFHDKFEAKRKEWLGKLHAQAFIQILVRAEDLRALSPAP